MSIVSLVNVTVVNNPAKFLDNYQLEITFECLEPLAKDIEWKLTYVGSANSPDYDQELDSLLVGPVPVGVNKFIFDAQPPNVSKIPSSEILGVTVVMLAAFYDKREFVRVGYYVSHEYDCPELQNEPPKQHQLDRIARNMLTEKPRVTRFAIKWDSEDSAPPEFPPDQPEADEAEDDGELYGAEEAEFEAAVKAAETAAEGERIEDVEMGGAEETTGSTAATGATEKIDEGAESEDLEADSSGESDEEDEGEGEGEADDDVEMADQDMEDAEPASGAPTGVAKPEL